MSLFDEQKPGKPIPETYEENLCTTWKKLAETKRYEQDERESQIDKWS